MTKAPKTFNVDSTQPEGLVVVASESTVSQSISLALSPLAARGPFFPGIGEIELIAPDYRRRPLLKAAIDTVRRDLANRPGGTSVMLVNRPGNRSSVRDHQSWVEVAAPSGTERFNEILVPDWWSRSTGRGLVTVVPRRGTSLRISPMSILAGLAHPRQRLAARLHKHREALMAELAAPWQVGLFVIAASRPQVRVVAVTHDMIAAELVWLALAAGDDAAEDVGPWEHPAVQRATQLGLGALGPHQMSIVPVGSARGSILASQIAARLGVTSEQ